MAPLLQLKMSDALLSKESKADVEERVAKASRTRA
jgi:hypothetical protein